MAERSALIVSCFDEHGERLTILIGAGGHSVMIQPAGYGHPGRPHVALAEGEQLAEALDDLDFAKDPHHCLPAPTCERCGRHEARPEQAMANAVMRGRLGIEVDT